MNKENIIKKTAEYIQNRLNGESSGHDWWHVYRVWKNAIHICKEEKADLFVVQLAALLHDIADWKFHKGDDTIGPRLAREWLEKLNVDASVIDHVCDIIHQMNFRGAAVKSQVKTKEGKIMQDADRLDAIGAIGIARAFATGQLLNQEFYNPAIKPLKKATKKQYNKQYTGERRNTTINHFYEKLLLLKKLMNTKSARKIAERRHAIMEQFLDKFFKEWNGKD